MQNDIIAKLLNCFTPALLNCFLTHIELLYTFQGQIKHLITLEQFLKLVANEPTDMTTYRAAITVKKKLIIIEATNVVPSYFFIKQHRFDKKYIDNLLYQKYSLIFNKDQGYIY